MAATNIQSFSGDVEVSSNLTVDTNTLHVDSIAGRVGIGKTDPAYAVDVNGTLNATSLYVGGSELQGSPWSSNNSNTYYTTGAVGIGTDFPKKDLEVVGTLRLSNAAIEFDTDLFVSKSSSTSITFNGLTYDQKITAPDAGGSDHFGQSLSISSDGSYAIVGAYGDDDRGSSSGSAYVYAYNGSTWSYQQKLTAPDGASTDYFSYGSSGTGTSISDDGSYAVVGAYRDGSGASGSAYIFSRSGSTWSYQQKIIAPDAAIYDNFGVSVSISGDGSYIVTGAPYNDDAPPGNSGSAYIYSRSGSTWSYQQKITAPDAAANHYFGTHVAMANDGSYLIVGAFNMLNQGAAYIYSRSGSTWSYQQKLMGPDTVSGDQFGYSVDISTSHAIVGARLEEGPTTTNSGAVYIYSRSGSTWSYQQKLTAPDAATNDYFNTVSISDDGSYAVVGAYFDDDVSADSGSAYIFSRSGSTWTYQKKITAPDPTPGARYGQSVCVSGDGKRALIGAGNTANGSVYAYKPDLTITTSNNHKTVITSNVEIQGVLQLSNVATEQTVDIIVTGGSSSSTWTYQQKMTAPDALSDDTGFGFPGNAISGDGSYAISGARLNDPGGITNAGAAYIYVRVGSTWTYQQKLTAPDAADSDYFGYSVAISDDGSYAIGATFNENVGTGAAYMYRRSGSTWSYQQKLTAPDAAGSDQFSRGTGISADGSYAIFGAFLDDTPTSNAGSAYIYVRSGSTWSYQQKLTAPDAVAGDYFGHSVSLSGDGAYALVGAYGDDDAYPFSGSAYIFSRSGSTWTYQQKLTAPDGATNDYFGRRVAISNDGSYALVGAFGDDGPTGLTPEAGSVYIFVRSGSTWAYQQKIEAPDLDSTDRFGYNSISITGDGSKIIVGSYLDDDNGAESGSAYIFSRSGSTWSYQQKITPPDAAANDRFGISTDISSDGRYVFVCSRTTNANYIFNYPDTATLSVTTPIEAEGTVLSFTGQHTCFPEGSMSQGMVVSANKNKYVTLNGPLTTGAQAIKSSESLPLVSLSNVANDRSAFGVVDHFENGGTSRTQTLGATVVHSDKEFGDNRVVVNSLGEGAVWVANTNGPLESGDYITTSNIAGYGQKQGDDILHSYTVAKITMDCDFDPKDVPIHVIKKDENGQNSLDKYGRIQWEEVPDQTEKEYRIRYLTTDGRQTDQANAVWKAAYVGCTYHCG